MLGLVPVIATFFGLGLDVRHVTLSAGQIAAASATLGLDVLHQPSFWWAVATLPLLGALNVGVSFYLAFNLAMRAQRERGRPLTHLRCHSRAPAHRTAELLPPRARTLTRLITQIAHHRPAGCGARSAYPSYTIQLLQAVNSPALGQCLRAL